MAIAIALNRDRCAADDRATAGTLGYFLLAVMFNYLFVYSIVLVAHII